VGSAGAQPRRKKRFWCVLYPENRLRWLDFYSLLLCRWATLKRISTKIPDFCLSGFEWNSQPDLVAKKPNGPVKYRTPGNRGLENKRYDSVSRSEIWSQLRSGGHNFGLGQSWGQISGLGSHSNLDGLPTELKPLRSTTAFRRQLITFLFCIGILSVPREGLVPQKPVGLAKLGDVFRMSDRRLPFLAPTISLLLVKIEFTSFTITREITHWSSDRSKHKVSGVTETE